jgi:molybdenum cofactor cytidylyltransferase
LTRPEAVAAVVLAAGRSIRFGSDKLLHPLRGKPLAAHIADTLGTMPFARLVAVCPNANSARAELFAARGFEIVTNPDAERGLSSSMALTAQRAMETPVDALLVCLGDMPNVTVEHLETLLAALGNEGAVATEMDGVRSPPALFSRAWLPRLAVLAGDRGARHLLHEATTVPASRELVRDFDLPSDFAD